MPREPLPKQILALLALLLAAASWGSTATFTKFALSSWEPMTLLLIQILAANIVLWGAVLLRGSSPRVPQPWRVARLGLLEPGISYVLITIAVQHTSAANATVIAALESLITLGLAAVILKETLTRSAVGAAIVAACGVLVLELTGGFGGVYLGDGLMLLGILAAASYAIGARRIAADHDPLTMTALQFTASLALIAPVALLTWCLALETPTLAAPPAAWGAALGVGVLGYAGSFLLYNFALAHLRAGVASMSLNLLPVFGIATAALVLGERITLAGIIGTALILVAVVTFTWQSLRREQHAH